MTRNGIYTSPMKYPPTDRMVVCASAHDPSRFDSRDPLKRTNSRSICLAGPGKSVTANRLFVIAEVKHTWWTLNTDKIPTIWSSTPNQDASGAVESVAEGGPRLQITTEPGLRMCPLVNQIVAGCANTCRAFRSVPKCQDTKSSDASCPKNT